MKVIDLLNKIANGEEVWKYITYKNNLTQETSVMLCCKGNLIHKLDQGIIYLDDEVEIMKDSTKKPIKHIGRTYDLTDLAIKYRDSAMLLKDLSTKVSEIIDRLNEMEK